MAGTTDRYVGRWVIHQTELKQQNNWLRGLMTHGNRWLRFACNAAVSISNEGKSIPH